MSADRISSAAGGSRPVMSRPPGPVRVGVRGRLARLVAAKCRTPLGVLARHDEQHARSPSAGSTGSLLLWGGALDSALDVAAVVAHCSQPRRKRCGSRRTVIVHSPSVTQVHRALADDAEVLDPRRGVRRRGRRVVRVDRDGRHGRADGLPHRSHGVRQARPRAGGAGRPRADLDRPQLRAVGVRTVGAMLRALQSAGIGFGEQGRHPGGSTTSPATRSPTAPGCPTTADAQPEPSASARPPPAPA